MKEQHFFTNLTPLIVNLAMQSFCTVKTNLVERFSSENVYVLSIYNSPASVLCIENYLTNKMGFPFGKKYLSKPYQPIKK